MSQRRILEFEIIGNSRGFEAAMNRVNSGLGRAGQQARGTTRELSLMDRQMMAVGTTARYALAGALVFGLAGAIQKLTEFQNQLGVVAGLAGSLNVNTGAYKAPGQTFLSDVGNEAELAANRVGIATDDVQSYMTRFYSTFTFEHPGNKKARSDMKDFVNEVTRLQALLGAEAGDPQQLAGGIAGFVNQIPGGKNNIGKSTNRVANLISFMTAQTPNITGRDISRDIGRVGATMSQTGMTPEQVFAVWGEAGKAGGSSSVIGRGVAQMLGNLLHPVSPNQIKAYQSIGLPTDPNSLRSMGAMNVLKRMMTSATTGPISVRDPSAFNNENIDDPTAAINAAGTKGINLNKVYGFFSRQESARQFVNLLAQGGVPALQKYIATQDKASGANAVYARETAALHQRTLARFNVARSNISLSLARGAAWPLENVVAPPLIHASNFLAGHTKTREAADAALGLLLLRSGAKRLLKGRGSLKGGGLAGAALTAEAAPNLLAGGIPTGARDNPLWVMIHPSSWFIGSPGGNPAMNPSMSTKAKQAGRLEQLGKKLLPFGEGAAGAGGFAAADTALAATGVGLPLAVLLGAAYFGGGNKGGFKNNYFQKNTVGGGLGQLPPMFVNGALDVTTKLVDAQGRTISVQTQKGVPVKNWGAKQMPTNKGKAGSRKAN